MSEPERSIEFDLHRFVRVIWSRAWLVVLASVAVVGPAIAWSNAQTPKYRASAEMVLEPKRFETFVEGDGGGGAEPSRAIATEAKRLRSKAVTEASIEKLGYRADIEASASGFDNVIRVTAVSTDPKRAADIANTFVSTYIQHRRTTTLDDILDAQSEIQKKIDEKEKAIAALDAAVADLPPAQRPAAAQARSLERTSLVNQQNLFRAQVDQLQVTASLNSGGAEMLTPASPPAEPFEPKVAQTALLAIVAGLMLGVGLAFLLDLLDDSIKGEEDLEGAELGLPLLGSVPTVRGWKKERAAQLVSIVEPSSSAAEGYRGLRASVQFLGVDRPLKVLQLTSPAVSEGKTTTTANLAVALARAGQRVVVMCCDLRRPRLHDFFEVSNEVGLTSVLIGDVSLDDALQPIAGDDVDLVLLASGPLPPNPSELLSGQHFVDVLAALRDRADIVVVDSPPVLPVSDAAVLSANVDATVLVVRPGRTSRKAIRRALAALRRVNAPVVGVVLNGVGRVGSYAYAQYRDEQASDAPSQPRRRPPVEPAPPVRAAEQRPQPVLPEQSAEPEAQPAEPAQPAEGRPQPIPAQPVVPAQPAGLEPVPAQPVVAARPAEPGPQPDPWQPVPPVQPAEPRPQPKPWQPESPVQPAEPRSQPEPWQPVPPVPPDEPRLQPVPTPPPEPRPQIPPGRPAEPARASVLPAPRKRLSDQSQHPIHPERPRDVRPVEVRGQSGRRVPREAPSGDPARRGRKIAFGSGRWRWGRRAAAPPVEMTEAVKRKPG